MNYTEDMKRRLEAFRSLSDREQYDLHCEIVQLAKREGVPRQRPQPRQLSEPTAWLRKMWSALTAMLVRYPRLERQLTRRI